MTSDQTSPPAAVPAAELEALFDGAPEGFVRARDALAGRLRAAGERDAAAWVKGLRKPTLAAWAVNRAARARDDLRRELLAATAALAQAQSRLLSGTGDGAELRAAADRQRAAEAALMRAVRAVRDPSGRELGEAVLERARETLAAVLLDEGARAELAAGRLTHERRAAGLGGLDAATAVAPGGRGGGRERGARPRAGEPRGDEGADSSATEPPAARPATGAPRAPSRRRPPDGARRLRELRAALAAAERAEADASSRRGAAEAAVREAGERLAEARALQAAADEALAEARTEERAAARAVAEARRRLRRVER